jgi:ABC-2 type transport system ATP-binding protein
MLMHMGVSVLQGTPAELKSSIKGDVVLIESDEPEALRQGVFLHFDKQKCTVVDNYVRTVAADGPKFVSEVAAAFPQAVSGISYHKPTLEDVFMKETGTRL